MLAHRRGFPLVCHMDIDQPSDPMRICAYSGVERPESQMVQIGGHYVAIECKDEAVQYLQQGNDLESRLHTGLKPTPIGLSPLMKRSWELTMRHAGLFLAIYFTIHLPSILLESYLTRDLDQMLEDSVRGGGGIPNLFWVTMLVPMAAGLIASLGSAATMATLSRSWAGASTSYLGAWFATLRRVIPLLSATIIMLLAMLLGFALCILPGIYFLVKLTFYECYIMDAGVAGVLSIERSYRLTKGRFWVVLGYMFLVTLMTLAPATVLQSVFETLPFVKESWALRGFLQLALSVPTIFLEVFTFVFYKSLRAASESAPAPAPAPLPDPAPEPPSQVW